MSKSKGTMKWSKVISYIVIVLVMIAVCGLLAYFTNGFTSDFKTFYVTVEGEDVLTTKSGYEITPNKSMTVDVKYTFGALSQQVSGYKVKVVPNSVAENDFDFTLDGSTYSFQAESDLTAGFDIEYGETSFTIKPKGGLESVLQAVYPNSVLDVGEAETYDDMCMLIITSYNGETSVSLLFSIDNLKNVKTITLDKEAIVL